IDARTRVRLVVAAVIEEIALKTRGGESAVAEHVVVEAAMARLGIERARQFVAEYLREAGFRIDRGFGIGVQHLALGVERGYKIRIRRIDTRLGERGSKKIGVILRIEGI